LGIKLMVRQKRPWTKEEDQILGTGPDAQVAARLKRPFKSVQSRRHLKKIRGYGQPQPWSASEERLLGKISDKAFARKYGRTLSAVKKKRIELGIPIHGSKRHIWTPEDEKLLGVRTDQEIAAFLHTTVKAVMHRRKALGIPVCARQLDQAHMARRKSNRSRRLGGHNGVYSPDEEKLLGTMSDEEVGKRTGRTRIAVQARRIALGIAKFDAKLHQWTAEEDSLLGLKTDAEIARKLGLSIGAVAHRRRRLGRAVRFAHRRPWTKEEDALLGTASDTEIAKKINRDVAVVCIRRQKLGIPNFYWPKRCGRDRNFKKLRTNGGA